MKFRGKINSPAQVFAVVEKGIKSGTRDVAQLAVQTAKKFNAKYWGSLKDAAPEMKEKLSPRNPHLSDF